MVKKLLAVVVLLYMLFCLALVIVASNSSTIIGFPSAKIQVPDFSEIADTAEKKRHFLNS